MGNLVRYKSGSGGDNVAVNVNYNEGTPLDSGNIHVAIIKSVSTTGVATLPSATPPSYTLIPNSTVEAINGNNRISIAAYIARGNGTINGVWVAGTAGVSRTALLHAINGAVSSDLAVSAVATSSGSASVATLSNTAKGTRRTGACVLGSVVLNGSSGGTGISWNTGTPSTGTGPTYGTGSVTLSPAPTTDTVLTTAWTTALLAAMLSVVVGGDLVSSSAVENAYTRLTMTPSDLTYTFSGIAGIISGAAGVYYVPQTDQDQTLTVTASDGRTTRSTNVTIPAALASQGLLELYYDGTAWV